ncbi:hypothetical protein CEE37_14365 [candidate division LCP-89 bacterium B3_LCP]|uniref:Uncharacterized protein n=1 Tax=candidate division LCP-89 bacterium B3_LCP TaxID=2012998 RepID=A0A532UPM4_UNCL8|nr:MAG: hypothetical protein CEE37_14365 [candidate division LCP-89 bacterium B3_LCP]
MGTILLNEGIAIVRVLKGWQIIFLIFSLFHVALPQSRVGENNNQPIEILAVSLKVLQSKLQQQELIRHLPEDLVKVAGLNRLVGYVVDEGNHDLIIIGLRRSGWSPVYLEDFVVSLRNAEMKYAEQQGHIYYYSHPGCSIDPNPDTLRRLKEIAQQINDTQTTEGINQFIEKWFSVSKELQTVRVLGIPFHTRFAKVMLQADYDMKSLVNGTDCPGVPGFKSLINIRFDEIQQAVRNSQPIQVSFVGMNRFWFYPGENHYLAGDGVCLIQSCPVTLLTEAAYIAASGQVTYTGSKDSAALEFTESFTRCYDQIAECLPIYRELENLFRWVALANMIEHKKSRREAGLDLDFLLNDFPVMETRVAERPEGQPAVKEFKYKREVPGGYEIVQFWSPSCGGVGIDIRGNDEDFSRLPAESSHRIRQSVVMDRPSRKYLTWPVQIPASDWPLLKQ